jgi:hypothetical protein
MRQDPDRERKFEFVPLARQTWARVQDYANAKRDVIAEIMARADEWRRRGACRLPRQAFIGGQPATRSISTIVGK